jgi:hypothetical protein
MLKSWESSCCGLERQLELTTAPLGVRDLRLNSPLESGLCWRRLTRQFSGWNVSRRLGSFGPSLFRIS